MPLNLIRLKSTPSTNAAAAAMCEADTPHGTVVVTDEQTAGRGQRGNHWESEPGQNLTFSIVLRPEAWPVTRQFELSMAVSIGAAQALRRQVPELDVRIKWPNDLYVGNGKLCGMLIENSMQAGSPNIGRAIAGIGINVNQTCFLSNAPNPVSLAMLTGRTFSPDALLEPVCRSIVETVDAHGAALAEENSAATLAARYHSLLWRYDGEPHKWLDTARLQIFSGLLKRVHPDGTLEIHTESGGTPRLYTFKQIAAVLT